MATRKSLQISGLLLGCRSCLHWRRIVSINDDDDADDADDADDDNDNDPDNDDDDDDADDDDLLSGEA